jgi:predicted dienelactone hydrolase
MKRSFVVRNLEILTALFLFLAILRLIFPKRPKWTEFLPAVALLVVLAQIIFEGYRWQMVPIYGFTLLLFLFSFATLIKPRIKTTVPLWKKLAGVFILLAFFTVSIALPILLPIPQLPKASGPFKVGTFSMMLTDESRKELYSGNPNDPRRIMVQVWYPAEPKAGDKVSPWMERADIISPAISRYLGLPSFFLDHLKYARTDAYLDAPVSHAQTTYPVLLFSHGWNGFRSQNTFQVINFASNGYVVVAIDHTYGAVATIFPDGEVAYNNPQALPEGVPDKEYYPIANKLVNQWSGDLGFVLDTLKTMNENDLTHGLTGVMDLEKVGVFGHSTGGGATVEFCERDSRCKAGLGLDAYMSPVSETVLELGLRQPFLFMFSEAWPSVKNWKLFNELFSNSDHATVMTILGTSHYDFSDLPILSPIAPQLGLKGPLSSERVIKIVGNYPLAFFNQVFYVIPTTLLDGPSAEYPEVVIP